MIPILVTLIQNVALLLSMMVVFELVTSRKQEQGQWWRQAQAGVILGGFCIGLMNASFQLETGVIFDTRSVLLSLSGLFFGPLTTVFAMAAAAVYRIWLGGIGSWTGIAVVIATGGVGILWRNYRRERLEDISIRELYGFGVAVHLVMLCLMLTLPWDTAQRVLGGIGVPVLLVYPIATISLGWLLANRLQRKNATVALAERETQYRNVFEAANIGKSVTLPSGEINVNRAFCDMLGYSPEELSGKTWQELTPPEEIGPINEHLGTLMRGEKCAVRFEQRYIHKSGSHIWVDVDAVIQLDRDGKPLHFITTVVDINDRMQAEKRLIESETRYQSLFENLNEGFALHEIITNAKGKPIDYRYLEVNPAFKKITGFKEDVIGKTIKEIFPDIENDPADWIGKFGEVALSGDEISFEDYSEWINKWVFVHAFSPQKRLFAVTFTDITDRKKAEKSLIESDEYHKALFTQTSIGLALTTMDGQLVDANEAYANIIGYSIEEVLKITYWELTPKRYQEQERLQLEMLNKTGKYGPYEKEYIHKDGRLVPVRLQGKIIEQKGVKYIWSSVEDISVYINSQKELKYSENKFRALVEQSLTGIYIFSRERFIYVNQRFCEIFGYTEKEILDNFKPTDVVEKQEREIVQKQIDDRLSGKVESVQYFAKGKRKDNKELWIEIHGANIELEGEQVVAGTILDVTEQYNASVNIERSEQKFRSLFEQASVGVAIIDTATSKYQQVNKKQCDIIGYTKEEILKLDFIKITHPDDLGEDLAYMQRLKDGEIDSFMMEKRYFHKNGSIVWVNLNVSRLWISGEDPLLHVAICEDITEKKNTIEALQESERKLREAQQMANLGHWSWDASSGGVEWSEEVYDIFGLSPEEFTPQIDSILALSAPWPEDRERCDELFRKAIASHEPSSFEHRFFRPDGSTGHYFSTFQGRYDPAGELVSIKGTVQDITERKEAEEFNREIAERAKKQRNLIARLTFEDSIVNSTIDDALQIITTTLADNLQVNRVSVWILKEDETKLQCLSLYDADTGLHSKIDVLHTADFSTYFKALYKDSQIDADDAQNDPRTRELTDIYFNPLRISSLLDTAIQRDGRLIGVLSAEHRGPVRKWKADEKSFLSAITNLVAQLFANAERRQAEEALRESEATVRKKLKSIVEPDGDVSGLELSDIMDVDIMQSMMEDFYQATGMLGAVLDLSGKVLVAYGWQDICTKFHRCHPVSLKNCMESDTALTKGVPPGTVKAYRCKNNMWDMVTPLMVGDRHIGNVFFGQFFFEGEVPDVELFRAQARQHGFDETEYLAALAQVPHFSREAAEAGLLFSAKLAGVVTTLSYNAIKQARMLAERERLREELITLNTELEGKVEQRTAALEASNKELEAFSYSVSHDLRAPLRHISGYVELLNKRFREDLPEKAWHYLNEVTDSAGHMGILIDDLLRFSRTSRQDLRRADMDMNAVVHKALEMLKPATEGRKISWMVADLPRVFGDSSLLQQVWVNLLENAVKYTRGKDEAKVEVGCTRLDDQWEFFVRDNGVGFDMQYVHKLFGVFQRLHSVAQFEGTGIGLANVQRIVNKHGGRVRAEGTPDEGASFYFTIPENHFAEGVRS